MTISLEPLENDDWFHISFWHWRTIVEAIRSLEVLPEDRVDGLHEQFVGTGLTGDETLIVAAAIRTKLLPDLDEDERLLIDGTKTKEPDDGVFHKTDTNKNYSTNREVLVRFADFCESSGGFFVL